MTKGQGTMKTSQYYQTVYLQCNNGRSRAIQDQTVCNKTKDGGHSLLLSRRGDDMPMDQSTSTKEDTWDLVQGWTMSGDGRPHS